MVQRALQQRTILEVMCKDAARPIFEGPPNFAPRQEEIRFFVGQNLQIKAGYICLLLKK